MSWWESSKEYTLPGIVPPSTTQVLGLQLENYVTQDMGVLRGKKWEGVIKNEAVLQVGGYLCDLHVCAILLGWAWQEFPAAMD